MLMTLLALAAVTGPQVVRHKDPITDKEVVMAIWASGNDALTVACSPEQKSIRVAMMSDRHYFGHTGLLTAAWGLTYRFDQAEPVRGDWYHDKDTVENFESGVVVPFIRGLLSSQKVVIRARENFGRGDDFDTTFEIGDARPAIETVVRECGTSKVARKLADIIGPAT